MSITGYSDRANHALAFAAKHHDRLVRQGMRPPYPTLPANVALILTRYGRDEETVIAGILHDVLEGHVHEKFVRDMLVGRIREKFGDEVLGTIAAATVRPVDDEGDELGVEDRRTDWVARIAAADERARWVIAASRLHDAGTVLADLRRTLFPETVWGRHPTGRDGTIAGYRRVFDRLREVGFDAPIMDELRTTVEQLERYESEQATGPATR
jgi:(p)ppGpp synthase/HD superfamily hydrolase